MKMASDKINFSSLRLYCSLGFLCERGGMKLIYDDLVKTKKKTILLRIISKEKKMFIGSEIFNFPLTNFNFENKKF